jgi:hypothetical protein
VFLALFFGARCVDRQVLGGGHLPAAQAGATAVPLPAWTETKEKALAAKSELWGKFAQGAKDWEDKNQVFGSTQKSNPHRPKAVLSVGVGAHAAADAKDNTAELPPPAAADEEDGEEIFVGGGAAAAAMKQPTTGAAPFSSKAWRARKAVEAAKGALLAIDEQRQLLQRHDSTPEQAAAVQACLAVQFATLEASLGFLPGQPETVADVALLASVCASDKGKRLVAKALALLPQFAAALLPTALRVLLATPPLPSRDSDAADPFANAATREAEEALAAAMVAVVGASQEEGASSGKHPFGLAAAKASLAAAMAPHLFGTTLHGCLASKRRAQVVQSLLRQGDRLCGAEPAAAQAYWKQLKAAFLDLAKRAPPGGALAEVKMA